MGDFSVQPQFVSRRYLVPDRSRSSAINQADDSFAVNRGGNSLPEAQVLKPGLLPGNFRKRLRVEIVHIEEQKIVFEPRTQIVQVVALHRLLFLQHREIVRAEPAEHVRVSGLEADNLRVLAGYEQKYNFIQIRQLVTGAVRLPIIWIALQHHALPGDVFLQTKWAEPGELAGRHGKTPGLRKCAGAVAALQKMARQNGDAIEQAFGRGIRLGQFKADGEIVHLHDGDGFSAHDQQVPL